MFYNDQFLKLLWNFHKLKMHLISDYKLQFSNDINANTFEIQL